MTCRLRSGRVRATAAALVAALLAAGLVSGPVGAAPGRLDLFFTAGDDPVMRPVISDDGRYVVFHGEQGFLVPGDTNGFSDVFLLDRDTDTLELVSRLPTLQSNGGSSFADISGDGRYVVWHSQATMFVEDDGNAAWDVFLLDRQTEEIERISEPAAGGDADGSSFFPSVSDDGRYVAFHSEATNLDVADTDEDADVFVKDRQTGAIELVSLATGGGSGNGRSFVPDLSDDGRTVAFESEADDLVADDGNDKWDVFVRDLDLDVTERVSLSAEALDADDNSFLPQLTGDGRFVAFESFGSNLVADDENEAGDIYRYDRDTDTTTLMSVTHTGDDADDRSLAVSITDDGQTVVYHSWAANLVAGDTAELLDVFMYTDGDAAPIRLSERDGVDGFGPSALPAISGDGSTVVFESLATNLDPDDDDDQWDIYVADLVEDELSSDTPTEAEVEDNAWMIDDFPETGFTDIVPGAFYEEGVAFLKANGITTGTSLTTYSPNREVTRSEMVTFLFRMGGSQWPTQGSPFIDVPETAYFLEPVKWAYQYEITTGTSEFTFSPYAPITRAQMATFLWRLAGQPDEPTPHGFVDTDLTAYYEPALRWLKESGITSGTAPDEYTPDGVVTRGQMAAFLFRLVDSYGWVPVWEAPE